MLDVNGKAIHVIGLGAKGTGRACATVLAAHGAQVTISDTKSREALGDAVTALDTLSVRLLLGDDAYQGIDTADLVVPSPGVPLTIEPIRRARAAGVPVLSEIELAYRLTRAPIVAITGTKGKTTTTTLIHLLLQALGQSVYLGGNIGYPLIEMADAAGPDDLLVAEVSSFQLEAVEEFRPHVAVFTNLYPDHLDRYDDSMELYLEAKLNLFRRQTPEDIAVVNVDRPESGRVEEVTRARVLHVSATVPAAGGVYLAGEAIISAVHGAPRRILSTADIRLRGTHNLANVLEAVAAVEALGLSTETVATQVLSTFRGVPNRLEEVETVRGVTYYNDSQGTTPVAVQMALQAFAPTKPVLIAGGRAKVSDFTELAQAIVNRARAVILIGEAADAIQAAVQALRPAFPVSRAATLPEAVERGAALAAPDGIVILSPACASFDMFTNMEHRGEVFRQAVAALRDGYPVG